MNLINKKSFLNYIFIFLSVNYGDIIRNYIHFDSANYGLCLLTVIAIIVNGKSILNFLSSKPAKYWTIICFFSIINYYLHPHPVQEIGVFDLFRFTIVPWTVLGVTIKEYLINRKGLLFMVLFTLGIYALMFVTTQNLNDIEEGGIITLVNEIATTLCLAVFYIIVLNRSRELNTLVSIVLILLFAFIIAMTGCRKAFYSEFIILGFWCLSMVDLKSFKNWVLFALIAVAVFWGYNYLMDNTYIGIRLEQLEDVSYLPAGAPQWMDILGDRAPMYYYAPEEFAKAPIFGAGLRQTAFSVSYSYKGLYPHSEFLAQLLDNGLVGFVLLFLFYIGIVKGIYEGQKQRNKLTLCMWGAFSALILISITAWTWQSPHFFILFGVLIAFGYENREVSLNESV